MRRLYTAFGLVIIGFSAVFLMPFGLVFFALHLIGLKKLASRGVYKIAQMWSRMIIAYTGCRLKVSGLNNLPKTGGMCVVSNHGSIFDIALHLAYAGRPFGFIAKKELAFVPFLDIWILLLGGVFVDRKNPRKGLKSIEFGIKQIQKGGAMIIFPEGTRSRGQGLLPFKVGSFKLAVASKVPIVPAAITGSYDLFEKTGLIQSVDVTLQYGPPIDIPAAGEESRRQQLCDTAYAAIKAMLGGSP
jgi:1-acyl-sn-glycerol-3-phosphate acyltransferase